MDGTKTDMTIHKCASNFLSLAREAEIVTDLVFLAEFDKQFFVNHMDFNRYTDEHISSSGFVAHHHLGKLVFF